MTLPCCDAILSKFASFLFVPNPIAKTSTFCLSLDLLTDYRQFHLLTKERISFFACSWGLQLPHITF